MFYRLFKKAEQEHQQNQKVDQRRTVPLTHQGVMTHRMTCQ
jgi:hypothetical protein